MANAASRGSVVVVIARSASISATQAAATASLKPVGDRRQVEVHPRLQRLHVAAGDERTEVPEDDARQQVQPGVRAHERATPLVLQRAAHRGADRRQWVPLGRDQPQVVTFARAHDPGLHPAPEQDAVVRGLTATAGVERRPVQHDPLLRVDREDDGIPRAQRLVRQLEPSGAAVPVGPAVGSHRRRVRRGARLVAP